MIIIFVILRKHLRKIIFKNNYYFTIHISILFLYFCAIRITKKSPTILCQTQQY